MLAEDTQQKAIALYEEGKSAQGSGDLEEAVVKFQGALTLYPQFIDVLDHLGVALFGLGRFADACEYLERSLALNLMNRDSMKLLAACYAEVGRTEHVTKITARIEQFWPA